MSSEKRDSGVKVKACKWSLIKCAQRHDAEKLSFHNLSSEFRNCKSPVLSVDGL